MLSLCSDDDVNLNLQVPSKRVANLKLITFKILQFFASFYVDQSKMLITTKSRAFSKNCGHYFNFIFV
jgi:hypothetical protein